MALFVAVALVVGPWSPQLALAGTRDRWTAKLHEIDALLREAEYEEASKVVERFSRKALGKLGTGDGARYALGLASMFRAIAEMGRGDEETALWYWFVAAAIYPGIQEADLTPYGTAAAFLKGAARADETLSGTLSIAEMASGAVKPPNCYKQVRPEFPGSLQLRGLGSRLAIGVVLGEDGSISHPTLLKAGNGPAEEFAALQAVREWRCDPAAKDGQPVSVTYVVLVTFR